MLAVMKKQLQRKQGKKGFTLVEVIVVLVILAILAAIAIPALTGYIEKANQRSVISEARNAQIALQAIGTDIVSNGGAFGTSTATMAAVDGTEPLANAPFDKYNTIGTGTSKETTLGAAVRTLMGVSTTAEPTDAHLTNIIYNVSGGLKSFTYDNGSYTVAWTEAGGYAPPEKN